REGAVAHVAVALLAGNGRVLACQGKRRGAVTVRAEHRLAPGPRLVTAFAVEPQGSGVAIAVAPGAGVRHAGHVVARVARLTGDLFVSADQREAGASV